MAARATSHSVAPTPRRALSRAERLRAARASRRPHWRRFLLWNARRLAFALTALCVALLGLVSIGTAFGRFSATGVDVRGAGVRVPRDSIAVLEPVATLDLREGDTIVARVAPMRHAGLYRVTAIDSWTHEVFARNTNDKLVKLKIGHQAGRVTRAIPYVGAPFRVLTGTAQGVALLVISLLLMARAAFQRRKRKQQLALLRRRGVLDIGAALAATPAYATAERDRLLGALALEAERRDRSIRRRFGGRWWIRVAALAMSALGLLSLTASANFTATGTINQGAIATGHMALTVPGAGATNRLTLGASGIAPGDRMQRGLDLSVDGTPTSGLMTGMTLAVTASPSSLLDS